MKISYDKGSRTVLGNTYQFQTEKDNVKDWMSQGLLDDNHIGLMAQAVLEANGYKYPRFYNTIYHTEVLITAYNASFPYPLLKIVGECLGGMFHIEINLEEWFYYINEQKANGCGSTVVHAQEIKANIGRWIIGDIYFEKGRVSL